MKKRWLSLYVENKVESLARISGLFSGKFFDYDSLAIGSSEEPAVARMTIGLTCEDRIFEQIKKQLNCCIEVLQVLDFSNAVIYSKELMFIKITNCTKQEIAKIFSIAQDHHLTILDYTAADVLLESIQSEQEHAALCTLFTKTFPQRVELMHSGCVAIQTINHSKEQNHSETRQF